MSSPAPAPAPIWPPTSSSRTNAASPSPTAANPPITSTPFTKTVSPSPSPFPFPVAPSTSLSSTIPSTSLSPSPSSFPPSLLPAPLYSSNPFPPPTFTTFPAPSSSSRPSLPPPAVTTFPPPSSSNPSPRLPFVTAYPPAPSSSSSVSKSQLPSGRVLGIVVGGVVMLVVLSVLCAVVRSFVSPKKRRRDEESYYSSPSPGPKDNLHNGGQQYQRPQNPPDLKRSQVTAPRSQSTRSLLKPMRPPPPPPPPPPFITFSSGSSGTSNSGPEHPLPQPATSVAVGFPNSTFTYEELARATDGFSDVKLLGQGGFGLVHRGVLGDGKEVAVKQMKTGSRQGEREFQSEVEIISRLHHKHLVSLVGYCISETMRMLVYEFVPNNTLEFHLHGEGRPSMDWPTRMKIALGSAKGLAYLHEDCHPKIIHRDIKAANILLDFKFEAKVADFGLAKFSYDVNTYVSTRVMGTFGYLAPEYASSGKLTDKSDVFSFGVMVLELITGHKPVGFSRSLVDWARPLLTRACDDGNFDSLVDPKLEKEYDHNEMARLVACAAACVRLSAQHRPRMSQIVRALEGDVSLSDLNNATGPGQSNIYSSSHGSLDCDTSHYNEDMEGSRRMASDSQGYGASHESSEPSSEAGSNSFGPSNERPKYSEPSSEGGSNPSCFSNEKPKCSEPSREGGLDHSGSSNEMLKYSEPSSEVGPDHFGSSNEKRKCSELNSDGGSNLSRSGKPSGEGDSNLSSSSKEESNQLENGTEKDEEEVNRNGTEKDEEEVNRNGTEKDEEQK